MNATRSFEFTARSLLTTAPMSWTSLMMTYLRPRRAYRARSGRNKAGHSCRDERRERGLALGRTVIDEHGSWRLSITPPRVGRPFITYGYSKPARGGADQERKLL